MSRPHCPLFNHCILSRSVYTCLLLALKFEADKDFLTTNIKGHVKLISRVVGTPKKRLSKAILSSRSKGTMSVTTFGCVYDLRSSISLYQFYSVDIISSNQMP